MREMDVGRPPDVSVIVVSWCTRELTLACLESVAAASASDGITTEIIVVDNASDDGTVEAIDASLHHVVVIQADTNLGFAAACNRGAQRATGRYLLMLNSDAVLPPGALREISGFLDVNPRAAVAGCQLVSPSGALQFSCGRFLTPVNQFAEVCGLPGIFPLVALRRSYRTSELTGPHPAVDWTVGACLAVRRAAFADVDGFDERFFMYAEDEDLCIRLRAKDYTVHLLVDTHIRHIGGGSATRAPARMRDALKTSQAELIRKHKGPFMSFVFRQLMRIASLKPRVAPSNVGWGR